MNTLANRSALALSLLALTAGLAQASPGGTIIQGSVMFRQGNDPASRTGAGVAGSDLKLNGPASPDQLVENWWWYRIDGIDPREYCLATAGFAATTSGWAGNAGWMQYDSPSYRIRVDYVVYDTGMNEGYVLETLTVTNFGAATLNIDIYNYTDFQVNGTNANDSANWVGAVPSLINVTDGASANYCQYAADPAPTSFMVNTAANVLAQLTNGAVTDPLPGGASPWGPGDMAGAFHWDLAVLGGASASVTVRKAGNTEFTDGKGTGEQNPDGHGNPVGN